MRELEFYFFHLMPYPDLPPEFDTQEKSAWVTLSNRYFDPETGMANYRRYLDHLEAAERYGWDGVCVNEHHQNAYGTMPSPNIMAAVLTQRTKRVKIGVIGNALPLHDDPLRVAEEIAMLDLLSGGRIISGFVRGTGMEYHSYNIDPTRSRDRFYEAHDLIIKAWTEPGPFLWEGQEYTYRYVNPWPRPIQQPHPPIWLPGTGSLETIEFAAEKRYPFMMVFSPVAFQKKAYDLYRRVAQEKFGYEASPKQLAFCIPTYVAESYEQARKEAEQSIMWLFHKGLKVPLPFNFPPGYVSENSLRGMLMSGMRQHTGLTMDDLINEGYIIIGDPDTVCEKLEYYTDVLGAGIMVGGAHCGDMPDELVYKNLELFSTRVIPNFRKKPAEVAGGN